MGKKKNQRKNSNYQTEKKAALAAAAAEEQKAAPVKKRKDPNEHKLWLRVVMLAAAFLMILSFVMLPAFSSDAADDGSVTVSSFDTGNLGSAINEALDGTDKNNVYRIAVSGGTLNASDYNSVLEMPNLEYIELAGAETENGVIPSNALAARNQLTFVSLPSNTEVISEGAFNNNKKLVKVSMPNTVKEIGKYAFDSCIALTDITVPSTVDTLGEGAFRDCQSLSVFTLPAGVTEIPSYCFSKCPFTEFYIGPQVTSIGDGAFADCNSLKNIYLYSMDPPSLGGGDVFRNLNVIVHTPDDADDYESWENNFVDTEDDFNEEYVPPETETAPAVTGSETSAEDTTAESKAAAESDENGSTAAESSSETSTEETAVSENSGTGEKSSIAPVIIITAVVTSVVTTIVIRLIKDRKK